MNKHTMPYNELLLWINALVLAVMTYFLDQQIIVIQIFFVINIIISGQIRRINTGDQKNQILMLLRRSLYIIPLTLPLFMGYSVNFHIDKSVLAYSLIAFICGLTLLIPKLGSWRIALSYDFIEMKRRVSNGNYISMALLILSAAIIEEFFYRDFIISNLKNVNAFIIVFLSTFMFLLHHIGVKWGSDFKKYDILIQIIFGILSSTLYIFSKSIIPSMVAHLTYNLPHFILCLKSYIYWNFISTKQKYNI